MIKDDIANAVVQTPSSSSSQYQPVIVGGLTKYEHFLGLAFQGVIASQPRAGYIEPRKAAEMAMQYTDELFNAVNHLPMESDG